jgi:hypothetical protein
MRRVVLIHLVAVLGLAFPARGRAQTATQAPGAPAAAVPQAPQAPEQAPAPAPDALPESSRSLFEPTWRQFAFGGRLSSVAGDPARFQRYGDLSDGVLFTDARYAREDPSGSWLFRASADNVGWRDQRYAVDYERTGRFVISGLWDEIPQFYSVDTRTPYTTSGGALVLDDATQNAIQGQQAGLSAYVPIAPQFDLRERRDIGNVRVLATPTPQLDVKAAFTTTRHTGELPWGASFGFGNDVEVALPYDSRTNDFTVGAEWTNNRTMFRVGYNGSWFDNLDDTLVWDSPLRLTDSTSAPGRGRMALWPSNSAQTVSAAGYARFARRTQLTGSVSYGLWNNDEPLQPFTINEALAQPALPRATAQAEAHVLSATVGLVSRPLPDWRFSGRVRQYSYDNQTGHVDIPEFINYDTSVKVSSTGGPEPYAHDRTNLDADVTWTGIQPLAVTVGYTRNNGGYDFRIFERTGENVFYVSVDAVGSVGHVPCAIRRRRPHGLRAERGPARGDRRAAANEALRRGRSGTDAFHWTGGCHPQRRVALQRLGRRRQGRVRRDLFRAAGIGVPCLLVRGGLSPAERPRRGRGLQLRALHGPAAIALRGSEPGG